MNTRVFWEAVLLFLPILAANQAAGLARYLEMPLAKMPVSERWLGANKTWAPYYLAPFLSLAVFTLLFNPRWGWLGALMGLGVVLAEQAKSFVKRLIGRPPGSPWLPDRIDFAVGGALVAWIFCPIVTWVHVVLIVAIALPVHYFGNRVSHRRGWRETEW